MQETTFEDADGVTIFYRHWEAAAPARGSVVVAHGASEHSGRYGRFADELTRAGFDVYAIDHRGHGRTADFTGPGRLGPRGVDGVLDDLAHLIDLARTDAGLPVVLFGHSMGSIFTQAFVERGDTGLAGYVLSGCPGPLADGMEETVGAVEGAVAAGMGEEALDMLGPFNEPFEPARTPFDWLSRDPDEVDAYIDDPLSGTGMPLTYGYVAGMLGASVEAMSTDGVARTPSDLPVLLVTGEMDPVSAMAAQVRLLEERLRGTGLDVTAHYYPGARHEVLNETNRDDVTADILGWLDGVVPATHNPGKES